jgi:pimeloyl-ACP methyl ester carboxylesterase
MKPAAVLSIFVLSVLVGCASTQPSYSGHGIVFYCDGAGGGGVTNWGHNVESGLKMAGYKGTFDMFPWETGMGVIVDQDSSVTYKRGKARELAQQMTKYMNQHPDDPVYLMGLSAGTAVAVFTLEALPVSKKVDAVVLLSGSLSSGYDLTSALQRVNGDVYVTTSQKDAILTGVVPGTGSADRKFVGDDVIGVHGCHMPPGASSATRRLYSKVHLMAWDPSWERDGEYGGHTDSTKPRFVADHIAPLLIREGPRHVQMRIPPSTAAAQRQPG